MPSTTGCGGKATYRWRCSAGNCSASATTSTAPTPWRTDADEAAAIGVEPCGAVTTEQPEPAGVHPPAARPRVQLPRPDRRGDRRSHRTGADPGAGHPAGLAGGL